MSSSVRLFFYRNIRFDFIEKPKKKKRKKEETEMSQEITEEVTEEAPAVIDKDVTVGQYNFYAVKFL